ERYAAAPSHEYDPQAAVEAAETIRAVRAALARIPKRQATVLALRYSGLSYAEMASALGIGVNQVGTRSRRAEARLRKEGGDAPGRRHAAPPPPRTRRCCRRAP